MSRNFQLQFRSFSLCCGIVASVLLVSTPAARAVIILTPGSGATGVTSTGLDSTTGPARPSVAPSFGPQYTQISKGSISVSGTGDLTANYAVGFINDNTGYNFLSDSVTGSGVPGTNRGWIPDSTGTETATFVFSQPVRLAGVDFLTLFTSRTGGTFRFDYSLNNGGSWAEIATVSNSSNSEVFRQGFSFNAIDSVTDVRLVTTATSSQLFIGEVSFFTVVPEPTTGMLLIAGLVLARRRARNCRRTRS